MTWPDELAIGSWRLRKQRAACHPVVGFEPDEEFEMFVRGCSASEMKDLRTFLGPSCVPAWSSDEQAIDYIVTSARRGELWAHRSVSLRPLLDLSPLNLPEECQPIISLLDLAPPAPTPEPAPSRAKRPWPGDATQQAETLERAANDGVPFCEVCKKPGREAEALATPSPTPRRATRRWRGDAKQQAKTLERAANDGAPFCEVCEQAQEQAGSPG